ncbi:MAG: hypothetical protein MJE66_00890 [Proteobacteria bacterium]|nr:hypothetical protein [Pseudomonadota bacterium]
MLCALRGGTALLLALAVPGASALASTAPAACDAGKLRCVTGAARGLLDCTAAAARRGTTPNPGCVEKAIGKLRDGGCFAEAEQAGACSAAPDPAPLSRSVESFLDEIVKSVSAAPPAAKDGGVRDRCAAALEGCAAGAVQRYSRCHIRAAHRGKPVSESCLDRAGQRARRCVARAEQKRSCRGRAGNEELVDQAEAFVDFAARSVAGAGPRDAVLADSQRMLAWAQEITAQGIRRPGYDADAWAETWSRDRFAELGLQNVELDPIEVERWQPLHWSLEVWHESTPDEKLAIPSYAVPLSAEAAGVEAPLVSASSGESLAGALAVQDFPFQVLPQVITRLFATWEYDPAGDFDTLLQVLPFGPGFQAVMEPSRAAGALGFIGLLDIPWESDRYYVPYDAEPRAIPGVWVSPANGKALTEFMAEGPTRGRLVMQRDLRTVGSHNVMGTLPGTSDEWVIIGSHHDGPWASAVEDAAGMALVLAQAEYWAGVPVWERPHNLLFLLNGGHMAGGAGLKHFVETRLSFLQEQVVTEIHLEHPAAEVRGENGVLVPTGEPEVRWWFTSFIPPLEEAVADAICREDLGRSFVMPVEGFPPGSSNPPTDGAFFHPHAPIVNFLTAPMYLFDEQDTLDKVHEPSLVPLSRAVVRIVNALGSESVASLRDQVYAPPRAEPLVACTPAGSNP